MRTEVLGRVAPSNCASNFTGGFQKPREIAVRASTGETSGAAPVEFPGKFAIQTLGTQKIAFQSEKTEARFFHCIGVFAFFASSYFTVISLSAFGPLNHSRILE